MSRKLYKTCKMNHNLYKIYYINKFLKGNLTVKKIYKMDSWVYILNINLVESLNKSYKINCNQSIII